MVKATDLEMNRRGILVVSIMANLALAGWITQQILHPPEPVAPLPTVRVVTNEVAAPRPVRAQVSSNAPAAALTFHWRQVESRDYATYVANLRAIGCPERTVRDILLPDVEQYYDERLRTLDEVPTGKFWLTSLQREALEGEKAKRRHELRREKRALIQELLGLNYGQDVREMWWDEDEIVVFIDYLPAEKALQVLALAKEGEDRDREIEDNARGILTPEDMQQKRAIYDDILAKLGQTLTLAELEEAELRLVAVAAFLFGDDELKGFPMTGAEFREVVRLKKIHDHPINEEFDWPDEAAERERRGQEAFEAGLKKLFGEKRYADLVLARDTIFQSIRDAAEESRLPRESVVRAYEVAKAAKEEIVRIRSDRTASKSERDAQIRAVRQTTEEALRQTLGAKALASFQSDSEGERLLPAAKP